MKSSLGFILFPVLIFMQIFSLISLEYYFSILFSAKNAGIEWYQDKTGLQANIIFKKLSINNDLPCYINKQNSKALSKQPIAWWQKQGCGGNFDEVRYYYVIEELGKDDCAAVDESHIANYFRVSLLVLSSLKYAKLLLQATYVIPVEMYLPCNNLPRKVNKGLQTMRTI